MNPFAYSRAERRRRRPPPGRHRRHPLPRRRHQPRRPDARDDRAAERLVDVTGLSDGRDRAARRRSPHRRSGAQHRRRRAPAGPHPLSHADTRHRRRRQPADPQHGDRGRQPAPAHPLRLFLRPRRRQLQQAPPRRGLRRDPTASTATTRSSAPRSTASPSIPPTCASPSPRSMPSSTSRARRAPDACRSSSCTGSRATIPRGTRRWSPATSSPRSSYRRWQWRGARPTARCATGRATPSPSSPSPRQSKYDDGAVADVRLALGGVAHRPWRAATAEAALRGQPATAASFAAAAETELAEARPLQHNAFKIELARRTIVATLARARRETAHEHPQRRQAAGAGRSPGRHGQGRRAGSDSWVPGGEPDPLIRHQHGHIGRPISRIDGPLKVSGQARFAGEFTFEGMVYAALAHSTIARGRITEIDTIAAEAAPGRRRW